MNIFYMLFYL